ncbi:MAG TPA: acyl-CoA thioesterase [Gammaproteobacteria bacterium]|jgi:acyl-CoA thioesterase YciA|nr:acyl-CoA thioesterase [Gammaproteobacteria bacterium]
MSDQGKPRGKLALQTVAMPADTNANGDIFGGWLVSNMDMATGIVARRRAKSRAVTRAIDKLEFLTPVNVGDTICCYAELLKTGRTSMQFRIEVWKISFNKSEDETLIKAAEGLFTFVAIDENNKPQPIDRS